MLPLIRFQLTAVPGGAWPSTSPGPTGPSVVIHPWRDQLFILQHFQHSVRYVAQRGEAQAESTAWFAPHTTEQEGATLTAHGHSVAQSETASEQGRTERQQGKVTHCLSNCYWSLARTAEAPLEHNFRYPRIRELTLDNDAIALGGCSRTF